MAVLGLSPDRVTFRYVGLNHYFKGNNADFEHTATAGELALKRDATLRGNSQLDQNNDRKATMSENRAREITALKARIAALESVPSSRELKNPESLRQRIKSYLLITAIVGGGFIMLALVVRHNALTEPADRYEADCLSNKGYGDWQGSSGITLSKYCRGLAAYKHILDDKKAHPENY